METGSAKGVRSGPEPVDEATRKRVAVETYARNETSLRRVARRFSLCEDDAEDALQRALEVLLRRAPSEDPRQLAKWTQTVVRHEALAIRRERERTLAGPAAREPEPGREDWVALLPSGADGPADLAERREAVARSREALRALKPQELRALSLLAEGYSYAEIGEIADFSPRKVQRCIVEGRERFRRIVAGHEDGGRCEEMAPLLSAFCDGEAKPEQAAELREHLRACARCRATLRAYRAAPAAAGALLPALPRSLWERAQDAIGELWSRLGPGGATASQASAGGVAAAAKVAVVCLGAAGGAAACVAGGLVPSPVDLHREREPAPIERRVSEIPAAETPAPKAEPEPAPEPKPQPEPAPSPPPAEPVESEPAAAEPLPSSEVAPEPAPPPAPEPAPEPTSSAGAGSPAGEFGP